MRLFKRPKTDEGENAQGGLVLFAVLFIAVGLMILNLITHLPLYIESLFIPVQHPLAFNFPKYDQLLHLVVRGRLR